MMKKKIFLCILLCSIAYCYFHINVMAAEPTLLKKEVFDNGYCLETYIVEKENSTFNLSTFATTKQKTGEKTVLCKDKNNKTLWSITVHGTFDYNGTTSKCTSVSMSKKIMNSSWALTNSSCSKSGNSCKATTTGKLMADGSVIQTINKTVTLKCSATGELS